MAIERKRPGVYIDLQARAKERILPKTGRVCVPYVAEWGTPNAVKVVTGYDERMKETLGLVDEIELAAEGGATEVLYRWTNGNEAYAKFTQPNSFEIPAKYPGTEGNNFTISIENSTAEPGKKEVRIKHKTLGEEFGHKLSVADVDELVAKTANLDFVGQAKKLGTDAIADVSDGEFTGGVSGSPSSLTSANFTTLFSAIGGADFDTLYLPTDDAAIQYAAKQFMADRRKLGKKLSTLVIGGKATDDTNMDKHVERSIAMNERFVVNNSIAGKHANGKTYNSIQWAAWVAGMIAATPAHISLTAQPVPLMEAAKDWGHTDILKGLANGVLMATRDGDTYIIESAVNTLNVLHPGEREDFGKIRVSMTLDQVMNDLFTAGKKYKGKLSNMSLGRKIFIGAAKAYLEERIRQGALAEGADLIEHPDKTSSGDIAYYKLFAEPLDAIEIFDIDWEVL